MFPVSRFRDRSRDKIFGSLWTPAQITTALWLDASDSSTITLNGTTVSQWSDKSGNNRNATQTASASQPVYSSNGLNNKPTLGFDGTNDYLQSPLVSNKTTDTSVFFVAGSVIKNGAAFKNGNEQFNGYAIGYGGGTFDGAGSNFIYLREAIAWGPTATQVNSAHIVSSMFGATDINNYLNGTLIQTITPNTINTPTTGTFIGGYTDVGNPFRCVGIDISEVLFVDVNLSTTDRQKMEGYLAWKWGLEANLPAGHPYKNLPPTV
jgi:hypothetical protein